ncbi:MAG: peptidyl-prolyl cis-trans isomerase [Planctomycetota bacterium]
MLKQSTLTTASLLTACMTFVGCGSSLIASNDQPDPVVSPEDFIGESQASDTDPADETTLLSVGETEASPDPSSEPATNPRPQEALPVDAMVGHINGEAVYADQIFDINLVAQLESFGRRFDREEFRQNAVRIIRDRLNGIIINKLILGEAELNLKETQRRGIEARIQAEREELLRFYGQGSVAKAKAEFLKERGKQLDQHLVDFREELVIGSYVRSKVMPKIVVNQRDVERYYADNIEKYQQPDQRVVRLIIAVDNEAGDRIYSALGKGQPFDKLAENPELNRYNPGQAGSYQSGKAIPGDKVINKVSVNEALLLLDSGEYAGPIVEAGRTYFVQVVELTPGVQIDLADAQIKIEAILRSTQFERQALRFRMDLLKRGSYSDPNEMGQKLLDIAFARYDR